MLCSAGLRPRLGLIAAVTDAQVSAATAYLSGGSWWRWPWRVGVQGAMRRVAGQFRTDSMAHAYLELGVPFVFVPGLDSPASVALLRRAAVDAGVLAEAPILRGELLHSLPASLLNFHAAPLPAYRGSWATYWALYHDEPLSVTAHLVEERTDQGPVLATRPLPVQRGDTLADIDRRGFRVCAELAVEVLQQSRRGLLPQPQEPWQGRTFRGEMPQDIVAECQRRLRDGEYTFFSD